MAVSTWLAKTWNVGTWRKVRCTRTPFIAFPIILGASIVGIPVNTAMFAPLFHLYLSGDTDRKASDGFTMSEALTGTDRREGGQQYAAICGSMEQVCYSFSTFQRALQKRVMFVVPVARSRVLPPARGLCLGLCCTDVESGGGFGLAGTR